MTDGAAVSIPSPVSPAPAAPVVEKKQGGSLFSQLADDIPDTPKDTERKERNSTKNFIPDLKKEEPKPETKVRKKEVEAEPAETAPPPAPSAPRILKLKAKGKDIDFDLSDDFKTKLTLEKGLGADEVFEHAAKIRKQAETMFEMLKSVKDNPQFLERIFSDPAVGVDFKQVAKDYVYGLIQEEQIESELTDEQREWRAAHRKQQTQEKDRAWEGEREGKRLSAEEKKRSAEIWEQTYETKIIDALKVAGIPNNKKTVAEMAWYLQEGLANNRDFDPHDVAEYIKSQQNGFQRTNLDTMTEDALATYLGEENLTKLRKYELKRLKSQTSQPFKQQERKPSDPRATKPSPKKMDAHDWSKDLMQGFLANFN